MKWYNIYKNEHAPWPAGAKLRVGMDSRWRIRKDADDELRPKLCEETVGFLASADISDNIVVVIVNPAIAWEGTFQELMTYWEAVPDDTRLTF